VTTRWWRYLDSLRTPGMSDRQLASFIDVTPATISRWKSGKNPGSAEVVQAAHAFGANAVDALVAGGILGDEETEAYRSGQISLGDVPLSALLTELQQRLADLNILDSSRSVDKLVNKRIAKGFFQ
jgi:transcriptional regulator with XRE-family HTH domain